MARAIAVISPRFCSGEDVVLRFVRKTSVTTSSFNISSNAAGRGSKFKVEDIMMSRDSRDRHVLFDCGGDIIATFRTKRVGAQIQWDVFDVDGAESLLFTVKKSPLFQGDVLVFLPGNTQPSSWDFKVSGSWSERSCTVYKGTSVVIATMHRRDAAGANLETFGVTVYPGVDRAFIVAVMILYFEINQD